MAGQATRTVSKAVYQMAVVTFISSIVWISVSIYEAVTKPVEVNVPAEVLKPINPTLDMEVLMSLQNRDQLSDEADQILIEAESRGELPTNEEVQSLGGSSSGQSETQIEEEVIEIETPESTQSGGL